MPDMGNIRIKDENMNKTTIITNVQTHLFELQDLKYRDFHAKLMPTVNKEKIIGVRTPALRVFAKKYGKTEGPEQRILRKDEAMTVYQILHYLDEPYKEVFTLKVLGELNYKEIAQIFGKQETWARVTYHRARVKIQDILERRST
jgi:RNA polymerase sigma factor (sigma-70 family)